MGASGSDRAGRGSGTAFAVLVSLSASHPLNDTIQSLSRGVPGAEGELRPRVHADRTDHLRQHRSTGNTFTVKPMFRTLLSWIKHLRKTDKLAVEATTNTWAVAEILRPFVAAVVVGNPLQIKAIAQAKVKTDKIDAEVLAQLLRCDYPPAVWHPDEHTQKLRRQTTVRAGLVGDRTRLKNRVQCLLAQLLIEPPVNVLFTKQGLEWLRSVELPPDDRETVDRYLRLYEAVEKELGVAEDQLMALAHKSHQAKLLMTLPGVAHGVAMSLLAALGDISRFKDGDHAASYLGLVPITRQSGGKCYHGRITKAGCSQTRQCSRKRPSTPRVTPARSARSSGGCGSGSPTTSR